MYGRGTSGLPPLCSQLLTWPAPGPGLSPDISSVMLSHASGIGRSQVPVPLGPAGVFRASFCQTIDSGLYHTKEQPRGGPVQPAPQPRLAGPGASQHLHQDPAAVPPVLMCLAQTVIPRVCVYVGTWNTSVSLTRNHWNTTFVGVSVLLQRCQKPKSWSLWLRLVCE